MMRNHYVHARQANDLERRCHIVYIFKTNEEISKQGTKKLLSINNMKKMVSF